MPGPASQPLKQFVRAGAGAGKTWNLIRQVITQALEFKQARGKWPKTVLTTFTRKATQELRERLLIYSLKEKPQALEFVQSRSLLNITTMHGLFHGFLTRYGMAMGLPGEFQIVSKSQADFWRRQILKELLTRAQVPKFLGSFGVSRLLCSLREFEPIYWTGAFRSPKLQDFDLLYRHQCQEITRKLKEFMDEVSSDLNSEKWQEYWQNLKNLIEQMESPISPSHTSSPSVQWTDRRETLTALKEKLNRPRKSKNNPGLSGEQNEKLKKILKTADDFLKKDEFDPGHWPKIVSQLRDFNEFARVFVDQLVASKKKEAALEPDDLEFFSLHLIQTFRKFPVKTPQSPTMGRNISHPGHFHKTSMDVDTWFIDEFQDTSPLQLEILETFIGEKPYYLVGDPRQSIYFFRGARSEIFTNKQKQVFRSGGKIKNLSKNYRSQAHLVKFFNDFFTDLFGKKEPVTVENTNKPPMVPVKTAPVKKENQGDSFSHEDSPVMEPVRPPDQGGAVTISEIHTEEDMAEVHHISQQISELLQEGISPRDMCVLTRTHREVDNIQKELSRLGFPVISHGHGQFFKRREILDAMGLLKFLLNPWDDDNLILLLRSPWVGLSDQDMVNIIGGRKLSFWPLFRDFFNSKKKLRSGRILCQALENKKHFGVGWCFRKALIALGFLDFSFQTDNTGRSEANLWKLINLVEKKSRESGQSLLRLVNEGFLSSGGLEDFGDISEAHSSVEPDKIHLMTVHASKGLEFKYVFMPFLHRSFRGSTFQDLSIDEDRGLWSLRLALGETGEFSGGILERLVIDQKLERERAEFLRLLYVAMTRAENQLFLSWKKEPDKKSWAFRIRNFIQQRSSLPDQIKWSVVNQAKAAHYSHHKESGEVRSPYNILNEMPCIARKR